MTVWDLPHQKASSQIPTVLHRFSHLFVSDLSTHHRKNGDWRVLDSKSDLNLLLAPEVASLSTTISALAAAAAAATAAGNPSASR